MNLARHMVVAGFVLSLMCSLLNAQQHSGPDWFLRQMFLLSDFNGDGQISKAEISQTPQQWAYFASTAGFIESDLNQDQLLSREEMACNAWRALVHRLSADEQELRHLQRDFSHLSEAHSKYLERYPGLARSLLGNVVWCRENANLVRKLIRNKTWLREQPEAADALQNNLIFWMEHPKIASFYYERPIAGSDPALYEAWRNAHRRYLSTIQTLPDKELLDFSHQPHPAEHPHTEPITPVAPPPSSAQIAKRAHQESDSLYKELLDANVVIMQLEQVIEVLSQRPEGSVETFSPEQLQKEIRLLRVELHMARLEEDSLLAESIRQTRRIGELETQQLTARRDQEGTFTDIEAENEELKNEARQLRRFISNQALEMESLNASLRQNQQLIQKQGRALASISESEPRTSSSAEAYNHLSELQAQEQSSIAAYKQEIAQLTNQNDRQRLHIDSLRLEFVQNSLSMQGLMDSLTTLIQIARLQADSLQRLNQQMILLQDADAAADSLVVALRLAERDRIKSEQQWLWQLDSLESIISQMQSRQAASDISFRNHGDRSLKEIIRNLEKSQEDLYYDNQKLRQQLETSTIIGREQETVLREQISAVLKNNRRLEYQNRKLRRRIESRRLPNSTVAIERMDEANFELMEAGHKIHELEKTNEALLMQLQTTQSYILQKMREEVSSSNLLEDQMKGRANARYRADTLSMALANALQNSWPDTVAMLREHIRDIKREKEMIESRAIAAYVTYLQQRDSLVHIIDERDLELIRMERAQYVSTDRINRIENREDQVSKLEYQLEAKRQLLEQRELILTQKIQELSQQEEKYQLLEQWEAELKRREQRLNILENGDE